MQPTQAAQALLYLKITSLRGQIRSRLKRLRQPKYLLGAVVAIGYLYLLFMRRGQYRAYSPMAEALTDDMLRIATVLGAFLLLVIVALSWVLPRSRAALAFSEAEIAFLFPGPLSRRTLIHYKLLSSQVALAFTALVLSLLSNRWSFLGGNALTHAIGWWIILATLNLHFTGSQFTITRLLDRGVAPWQRYLSALGVVMLVIMAVVYWGPAGMRLPSMEEAFNVRTFNNYLDATLSSGLLPWLLGVTELVIAPFLAEDATQFLLSLGPALLMLVLHYMWVLHSEVSFEEGSIAKARKRAAMLEALRSGNIHTGIRGIPLKAQRERFRLRPAGRPEVAILWKNLLLYPAYMRQRTAIVIALVIFAGCTFLVTSPQYLDWLALIEVLALVGAITLLLVGPLAARQDLRLDMLNVDILKTYPLRGSQIVLGEILAPLVVLSVLLWLLLLTLGLSWTPGGIAIPLQTRLGVALMFGLVAVPYFAIQLLVMNAMTLLFAAWVQSFSSRHEFGLDVLGQRILFVAAMLIATVIALLPAIIVAMVLFPIAQWLGGIVTAMLIAGLAVFAVLSVEAWLLVRWLGTRFERFDLSSELRV